MPAPMSYCMHTKFFTGVLDQKDKPARADDNRPVSGHTRNAVVVGCALACGVGTGAVCQREKRADLMRLLEIQGSFNVLLCVTRCVTLKARRRKQLLNNNLIFKKILRISIFFVI